MAKSDPPRGHLGSVNEMGMNWECKLEWLMPLRCSELRGIKWMAALYPFPAVSNGPFGGSELWLYTRETKRACSRSTTRNVFDCTPISSICNILWQKITQTAFDESHFHLKIRRVRGRVKCNFKWNRRAADWQIIILLCLRHLPCSCSSPWQSAWCLQSPELPRTACCSLNIALASRHTELDTELANGSGEC